MSSDPLTELSTAERARLEAVLVDFDLNWTPDAFDATKVWLYESGLFRLAALREMVKIDRERHARHCQPVPLQLYLDRFPELFEAGNIPADLLDADVTTMSLPNGRTQSSWPSQLPEQFGRYRILRPLGRGGMGSVYLARDTELDRLVALKIPHFQPSDVEAAERFAREARRAAMIDHPNICRVYDVGRVDDTPFLTMSYVEGPTLEHELRAGPFAPRRAAEVIRATANALAEAHRRNVIHRDLKPANILIDPNGQPVVVDFGLAQRVTADMRMTEPGAILGTPLYMSPEQVAGDMERVGPATDIYSLGVILYELLIGKPPFAGSRTDVFTQTLTKEPPPPSTIHSGLDRRLDAISLKALAKSPAERFNGMTEFAAALNAWLQTAEPPSITRRSRNRRLTWAILGALALALLFPVAAKLNWFPTWHNPDLPRPQPPKPELTSPTLPTSLYVGTWSGAGDDHMAALALTPDGQRVHAGLVTKSWLTFRIWDATTGQDQIKETKRSLHSWVKFSADGHWFLAGGGLGTADFGRVGSDRPSHAFAAAASSRTGAITRDGKSVLVGTWSLKEGDLVQVWDVETGKSIGLGVRSKDPARCSALSEDGRWAYAASPDREMIWEVDAKTLAVDRGTNSSLCAAFAPQAVRVYVGSEYGRIQVYEPPATEPVREFYDGHTGAVTCLAVSSDGLHVATGGDDGSVRIWVAATGQQRWQLDGHIGRVTCVAFAARGQRLVSAGIDRTWPVWELPD